MPFVRLRKQISNPERRPSGTVLRKPPETFPSPLTTSVRIFFRAWIIGRRSSLSIRGISVTLSKTFSGTTSEEQFDNYLCLLICVVVVVVVVVVVIVNITIAILLLTLPLLSYCWCCCSSYYHCCCYYYYYYYYYCLSVNNSFTIKRRRM